LIPSDKARHLDEHVLWIQVTIRITEVCVVLQMNNNPSDRYDVRDTSRDTRGWEERVS
jgi:hypothetical protein